MTIKGTTACKWDVVIPFEPLWEQYKRIIKDKGAIVLFGSEPFSSYLRMSNIKNYKYDWKWDKVNGSGIITAKFKPLPVYEDILVFGNDTLNYYPIMELAEEKNKRPRNTSYTKKDGSSTGIASGVFKYSLTHNENLRFPKNKLVFNNKEGELNALNRVHPTQKPIPLLEYLIKTYTLEGETVLDNTMGSGSTGVACINTKRNFIGIEKDDKYFELSVDRVKENIKDNYELVVR